ncbi:hypothetical protein LCGC14_0377240 [marine sediment metagenome]|uniref:Recombination endonuclease VII n=1 Tax=marine sediment metagenome TaxID=412755 RepID=A0A0F9WCE1_9ZZZZ
MVCYVVQKQSWPAGGTSGSCPYCVATPAGSFLETAMKLLKCSTCKEQKPENDFTIDRHCIHANRGQRSYFCRDCEHVNRRKYLAANPHIHEKMKAYKRQQYKERAPELILRARENRYVKMYGITIEDYDAMLVKQNGKCNICGGSKANRKQRHFHVDHNHKTGKTRALLCGKCNQMIGLCREDPMILQEAINYLFRHLQ